MRMLLAALMRYVGAICFRAHGQAICLRKRAVIGNMRMLHGALMWYFLCFGASYSFGRGARATEFLMDCWNSGSWNRLVCYNLNKVSYGLGLETMKVNSSKGKFGIGEIMKL